MTMATDTTENIATGPYAASTGSRMKRQQRVGKARKGPKP